MLKEVKSVATVTAKGVEEVTSNEEIIKLRKSLFEIEEVKEYSKLESEIRLYSKKISNEISSIVEDNNKKC